MDHIKLVHVNAERNKMTSQALAICFGPLFSCHYESDSVHKAIQVFKFLLEIWPARRGKAGDVRNELQLICLVLFRFVQFYQKVG